MCLTIIKGLNNEVKGQNLEFNMVFTIMNRRNEATNSDWLSDFGHPKMNALKFETSL